MSKDYYAILGLHAGADEKEIKRAFRKLAKKYHPDTNQGNPQAEQKFQEINEAYGVLSDPEKKKIYDKYGYAAFENGMDPKKYAEAQEQAESYFRGQGGFGNGGGSFRYGGTSDGGPFYQSFHFNGNGSDEDFSDIFRDLFGSGKGGFTSGAHTSGFHTGGGFRGQGFGGTAAGEGSLDAHAEINITFEEAVFGCEKTIRLSTGGNGGTQTLRVTIPAGMEDGKSIRLRGKGNKGSNGKTGDLYLKVHVGEHPGYERRGYDIYTSAKIPFTTAVFGGEAVVPTLYGNVKCRIPKGTQSGSKIRLRGKGVVHRNDASAHGDEYVTIQIEVPRNLTPDQEEKLHEFEHSLKHTV